MTTLCDRCHRELENERINKALPVLIHTRLNEIPNVEVYEDPPKDKENGTWWWNVRNTARFCGECGRQYSSGDRAVMCEGCGHENPYKFATVALYPNGDIGVSGTIGCFTHKSDFVYDDLDDVIKKVKEIL